MVQLLCFCVFIYLLVIFGYRVLTPYYTEEVLFSLQDLDSPNEDGVSILFYLQKIFPGLPIHRNLFCYINIKNSEHIQCIFCYRFGCQCTDEWNNFIQRVKSTEEDIKGCESDELVEELRLWASYRGQTLTRTGSLSLSLSPLPCACTHDFMCIPFNNFHQSWIHSSLFMND